MERGERAAERREIQIGFILMAFVQTCMCAAVSLPLLGFSLGRKNGAFLISCRSLRLCDNIVIVIMHTHGLRDTSQSFRAKSAKGVFKNFVFFLRLQDECKRGCGCGVGGLMG